MRKIEKEKAFMPRMRFPGFLRLGDWKSLPLGKILSVRDDRKVPSEKNPLYSLTIENGITEKSGRYDRKFLVQDEKKKYKLVLPGDIVYNPANLRWGAISKSTQRRSVVVSPIYEVLYVGDTSSYSPEYIEYAITRPEQIKLLADKGQGTLIERIAVNVDDFCNTPLPLPALISEQRKIADCLGSLDDLIAAEGRKLAALRHHKKGLMQQLFPREGETRPRLRFPEFRNGKAWEKSRLGDIVTLEYGDSLPEKARTGDGFPVVGSNGIVGFHETATVSGPAIVVGRKGSVGKIGLIGSDCTPIDTTFYIVLKRQENDHLYFIWRLLESSRLDDFASASAIPGLSRNDVYARLTAMPAFDEQQRIADCLFALDTQIAAQSKQLDALRTHKRGLMQQLFPKPDNAAA